ncbi:hypothetical protein EJB05_27432, partial [Eragrostis curvula]
MLLSWLQRIAPSLRQLASPVAGLLAARGAWALRVAAALWGVLVDLLTRQGRGTPWHHRLFTSRRRSTALLAFCPQRSAQAELAGRANTASQAQEAVLNLQYGHQNPPPSRPCSLEPLPIPRLFTTRPPRPAASPPSSAAHHPARTSPGAPPIIHQGPPPRRRRATGALAAGGLGAPTSQGDATRGTQHHPAEAPPAAPGAPHHAFEEAPPAAPGAQHQPASTSSLPPGCDPAAAGFGVSAEVGELRAAGGTPSAKDETPSARAQGGGEGAHHHTEPDVFEEAPPAALTPDASVRHAATSSLPQGTAPVAAPARVPSSSATSLGADEAGLVDGSSSQDGDPAARPQDGAQGRILGADAVAAGGDQQTPLAGTSNGVPAVTNPGAANSSAPGAGRFAVPRAPTRRAMVQGPHPQWIDDEEYTEEVIDPEIEARRKYVKKVSAWRKGFTICLICHLKEEETEIKAKNDVIIKHCLEHQWKNLLKKFSRLQSPSSGESEPLGSRVTETAILSCCIRFT